MYKGFFKRLFDIVLSMLGIIILSIPMLIIAIAIKCDSKGPAIFKTKRVGRNNKNFTFYKFRSMAVSAPKDCAPRLLKSEDYITKVGKFIRKTSLDELPQMFCIFVGSMSIIGPRPSGLSEKDLIDARAITGADKVTPGLTGLAQINGRDILASDIRKKAEYDGLYAQNITFLGDMKIFFKTIVKVIKHDGIVEGENVLTQPTIQTIPLSPELAATTPPPTNATPTTNATITPTTNPTTMATTNATATTIPTIVPADNIAEQENEPPTAHINNIVELENELRDNKSIQNTAHTA